MVNPFEELAQAIILQAVKDYRATLRQLIKNPRHAAALRMKQEITQFYRSGWFAVLTTLDPEMLIRKLDGEVSA